MEPRLSFSHRILSSITSTELQKIILLAKRVHNSRSFAERIWAWTLIDKQLYDLVARLGRTGHRRTLEVEVRFTEIDGDPGKYEFTKFLPKFREKGVVTIVDAAHDRVLHSSIAVIGLQ